MSIHPSLRLAALALAGTALGLLPAAESEYAGQFNYGQAKDKGTQWAQAIRVVEPAYRSTIDGTTTITFTAPGMDAAEARCWHQPDAAHPGPWGYDAVVQPSRRIGEDGAAVAFEFPGDDFPHGPITIRIATRSDAGKQDLCELQLYNAGGVRWDGQGIPDGKPAAAEGLQLVFADDFETMPSISPMGVGTTYMAHKPPNGSQDFSGWRFAHADDFPGAHDPYEQHGTWLRIKARAEGDDKRQWGSGIIAPMGIDGAGVATPPPFYMECRFTAQSAPGTWPAFWTLTVPNPDMEGSDELDIFEGYGGVGPGNPNDHIGYHVVSHFWRQEDVAKRIRETHQTHVRPPMMTFGGQSYWSTTFHTYGLRVDAQDTVYYCDGHEVLRHPTGPISASTPAYFLVNYAIGGISGWKIDLERYGNASDMWVDYVRVYSTTLPAPEITPASSYLFGDATEVRFASSAPGATIRYTLDGSVPTASSPAVDGAVTIAEPCTITAVAMAEGMTTSVPATTTIQDALAARDPGATQPGLRRDYHEGEWEALPDFGAMTPAVSEVATTIALPGTRAEDHFGLRFTGFITVPADGMYAFATRSDDGSELFIDGQRIVDNGGLHGAVERSGEAGLRAGTHAIEIRYFEAWGGESLEVTWQPPGGGWEPIPAAALTCTAGD